MAASTHGGTCSHVAVERGAWGGERGAAAVAAAAAARRHGATPTGEAVTPPRSARARGRQGARAGGWDRPPRHGAPLTVPRDIWLRRTVLKPGSQVPDGLYSPCPPPSPRLAPRNRAQRHPGFDPPTLTRGRSDLRAGICCGGSSAVSDAIERRGYRRPIARGRSHPPARAPCRPPRPPCAGALRGGVTAPPVGVA